MLQRLDVRHHDSQQVVRVAGHQVHLHHFLEMAHGGFEARERSRFLLFEADLHEHIHLQAERMRIGQRHVARNHFARFQVFHAGQGRGWRKIDFAGQFDVAER